MSIITIGHPVNMSYDVTTSQKIDVRYRVKSDEENRHDDELAHSLRTRVYEIVIGDGGIYLQKKVLHTQGDDGDPLHTKK